MELSSLEHLKNTPHRLVIKKTVIPLFLGCFFYLILLILAGNEEIIKSLNEFETWPDLTTYYGVSCL